MIKSFYEVGMGIRDLTIIKGGKKIPCTINGSLKLIGHEHELKPQHNPFRGDLLPPSRIGYHYEVLCTRDGCLEALVIVKGIK